jgi:RHS repeat-associated protein
LFYLCDAEHGELHRQRAEPVHRNREVLEYDGATGAIQRWYAYGLGSNDVLAQMNVPAATRATLIPDIQGSVIASIDSASGAVSKIGYLPYGKSGTTPPFGFTAQRIDPETGGLYYYRARHYSPAWGRFLQPDPIGYAGSRGNLYAYVGNDPLNQIDPTGQYTLQIGIAGGATIFGIAVTQGGYGIAIDTRGNVGTYTYLGAGVGIGASASVGLSLQVSNAQTIYDLRGAFSNTSLHGGAGLGGSVDYFVGKSPNGPVFGGGVTFGASQGGSVTASRTTTQVCGTEGCVGDLRDLTPESMTPTVTPQPGQSTSGSGGPSDNLHTEVGPQGSGSRK